MTKDRFELDNLVQKHERQLEFRTTSWELSERIKNGSSADPTGEIALLLELAFTAGLEFNFTPKLRPQVDRREGKSQGQHSTPRSLMEDELPSLLKHGLFHIKLGLGFDVDRRNYTNPNSEGLVMLLQPDALPRDKWFNAVSGSYGGWSNKAVAQMVALGLYETPMELDDGWKVTFMTEWGYQLFKTGATRVMEDRYPGGSTTYREFAHMQRIDRDDLFRRVARLAGFPMRSPSLQSQTNVDPATPRI
ncbi:hypothetical protein ELI54_08280 [Rhizobium ruizarguesonis]|uniref:hypothetical protein n=1 Tax=Rhizobium ruizarguesonis TaxID=2081791 RepID=UPI001031F1D7|nr:hypothetical protein [Rhizobium ruizarguesonis]TAT88206.1 hypothetical protein ELI54_08280 [Rhizobium ruizarguesonis]